MTAMGDLSDFISGASYAFLPPETRENVKMHVLDTLGAMLAGAKTKEGLALGRLAASASAPGQTPAVGNAMGTTFLPHVLARCAAARCTEVDDIHLESCTTPGSVVVPAAVSLAEAGCFADPREFLLGVALGYEALIRLGLAVDGPAVLDRGIWPTYLGATLGSAAVAARALRLSSGQTAYALSMALAMSRGLGTRAEGPLSSRWVIFGVAAQNGVVAALAAGEGFTGDETFFEKTFGRLHGVTVLPERLVRNLGKQFLVDETGMKPYPVGRQAFSAVEAFREIIKNNQVDLESIQEVFIWAPTHFVARIDYPAWPEYRMDTVRSVQYQIALAAFDPATLFSVAREGLRKDGRMTALMEKIRVQPSEELDGYYPKAWPARVEIRTGGKTFESEVLHPKGDPENRFGWDEIISKFQMVTASVRDEKEALRIAELVSALDSESTMTPLVSLVKHS